MFRRNILLPSSGMRSLFTASCWLPGLLFDDRDDRSSISSETSMNYTASQKIILFITHCCVHKSHHWSLSWAKLIQSTPSHLFPFEPFYLPIYVCISQVILSAFLTEILFAFLVTPTHVTCPAHLIFLDLSTLVIFREEYKLWSCWRVHSSGINAV
jgi:hypothetical protein